MDGEERRLKQWDFFHASPGTHHIRIGAGEGPCAILMAGARGEGNKIHYPRNELAARYDASSPEDTTDSRVATATGSARSPRAARPGLSDQGSAQAGDAAVRVDVDPQRGRLGGRPGIVCMSPQSATIQPAPV